MTELYNLIFDFHESVVLLAREEKHATCSYFCLFQRFVRCQQTKRKTRYRDSQICVIMYNVNDFLVHLKNRVSVFPPFLKWTIFVLTVIKFVLQYSSNARSFFFKPISECAKIIRLSAY